MSGVGPSKHTTPKEGHPTVWTLWPIRRRVLVNLIDGRAFDAVLYRRRGQLMELRDTQLLEPGSTEPVAIDGAVVVERARVAFIQVRN